MQASLTDNEVITLQHKLECRIGALQRELEYAVQYAQSSISVIDAGLTDNRVKLVKERLQIIVRNGTIVLADKHY